MKNVLQLKFATLIVFLTKFYKKLIYENVQVSLLTYCNLIFNLKNFFYQKKPKLSEKSAYKKKYEKLII